MPGVRIEECVVTLPVSGTVSAAILSSSPPLTVASQGYSYDLVDSFWEPSKVDPMTDISLVIQEEHSNIHNGITYGAFNVGTPKGIGATTNIYLKTPAATNTWIHMLPKWETAGAAYLRILEAPTVTSATGTPRLCSNRNRNVSDASIVIDNEASPASGYYSADATVTASGTIVYQEYAGTNRNAGEETRANNEWVLKQGTSYVFEMTSDSVGNTLSLNLIWYEWDNTGVFGGFSDTISYAYNFDSGGP
jgi:hypothetical protein